MRKLFSTFGLLLGLGLLATPGSAQNISRMPGSADRLYSCFQNTSVVLNPTDARPATTARPTTPPYNPYGYTVTMRGELHVLVVYAGFTNDIDASAPGYGSGDWPQNDNVHPIGQSFPANASTVSYTSPTQFSATATDPSISNLYYQMSRFSTSPLKMILHPYPKRINVTANDNTSAGSGFIEYTNQVIQALKTDPASATFDFSQVDRRTNNPNYQFDNSTTSPDGIIDFVVVVWRSPGTPYGLYTPVNYGGGGFANTAYATGIPSSNNQTYSIDGIDGFTQSAGMSGIDRTLFLHEFAHCTFQCPHYLTANGIVGTHFYAAQGAGMMGGIVFSGANAWERWYNGWGEMTASGVNSDIQGAGSLASGGLYTLRDFLTTGDMLRIKLPNSTQYLYLENRAGFSVFDDRHTLINGGQGQPLREAPRGLIANVVDITDDRTVTLDNFTTGADGIKPLSGQGSFDYTPSATPSNYNGYLWGNMLFNFQNPTPNPFGGHSQSVSFRMDTNNDGIINYSGGTGTSNEGAIMAVVDGQFEDGLVGPDMGFFVGQKMGIGANPAIFEHQTYDGSQLSTIKLNGLSVEITGNNRFSRALYIKVRFDDVLVNQNTRWTGDLRMTDVMAGSAPDVQVSGATLTINKSGTANRHTLTAAGDFINPTRFVCPVGTTFAQDSGPLDKGSGVHVTDSNTRFIVEGTVQIGGRGSGFLVDNGALLDIKAGGTLDLAPKSSVIVEAGGTLVIRQGANISGHGFIEVRDGAFICLENGINWQTDTDFTLYVSTGATVGSNPALSPSPGASCSGTIQNYCGTLAGGNPNLTVTSNICRTMNPNSQPEAQPDYSVTPNPATDQVTVSLLLSQAGPVTLSVQDMSGFTRLSPRTSKLPAGRQSIKVPVESLSPGIYMLVVESSQGRQVTRLKIER